MARVVLGGVLLGALGRVVAQAGLLVVSNADLRLDLGYPVIEHGELLCAEPLLLVEADDKEHEHAQNRVGVAQRVNQHRASIEVVDLGEVERVLVGEGEVVVERSPHVPLVEVPGAELSILLAMEGVQIAELIRKGLPVAARRISHNVEAAHAKNQTSHSR